MLSVRLGTRAMAVLLGALLVPAVAGAGPTRSTPTTRRTPKPARKATPKPAPDRLRTSNNTPFPASTVITGATWTSPRFLPPSNQSGDILPTIWGDDGNQYTIMDDGGTGSPTGKLWKQSLARIAGTPPRINFSYVGNPSQPAPYSFPEIKANPTLWTGPLGPYYSSGLVEANKVLFATQELDWTWNVNGPFTGLAGIAYSTDLGQTWNFPAKPFPAPLGNLSWVIRGQGGHYVDGYVYAIATEREFNATNVIMGRSRPDPASMTDPSQWQWVSGWTRQGGLPWPTYSSAVTDAVPIASWPAHITYPQMAYDAPLHRYLLTFTHSYAAAPPGIWKSGSELVILTAPHPWGPFSFVARQVDFGPSNGYDAGIPLSWISPNGRLLWMKWAANFDGCDAHLNCSGAYGFNYRQLLLTTANGGVAAAAHGATAAAHTPRTGSRTATAAVHTARARARTSPASAGAPRAPGRTAPAAARNALAPARTPNANTRSSRSPHR